MRTLIVAATLVALAVPAAPALAQRATAGYAVRATTMRAGPDYAYPAVRRVARNVRGEVYGCLSDRSWCDAGYRSDRGWISGRDLVVDDRGRRRGISDYAGIGVLSFIFGSYWDSHYRGRSFYTERPRWERRYRDNYRPSWGPRPQTPPAYQQQRRQPVQPVWPGAVQPPAQIRPQPQPRATGEHHRSAPTQVPSPGARRSNPTPQPAPDKQRRGRKGEGAKQP